jgi:hypothetical protein
MCDSSPDLVGDVAPIIRQTSELRRLCLSLREAAGREDEEASLVTFREAMSVPSTLSCLSLRALRAGVRSLWQQGHYTEIVAVVQQVPEDRLAADETVLMYALCAAGKASAPARTVSA